MNAAALGALGFNSKHNITTRWAGPSFDSATVFGACANVGDFSPHLRVVRRLHTPALQQQVTR